MCNFSVICNSWRLTTYIKHLTSYLLTYSSLVLKPLFWGFSCASDRPFVIENEVGRFSAKPQASTICHVNRFYRPLGPMFVPLTYRCVYMRLWTIRACVRVLCFYVSVCVCVCLSAFLSVCLSGCLAVWLSVCLCDRAFRLCPHVRTS